MQKFMLVFIVVVAFSCNKDDDPEQYSSINGYWIVRTPDDATDVTFRVAQNTDNLFVIDRVQVNHNDVLYDSKPIDARITVQDERSVESITFVNNSFEVPFFVIRFQEISVNEDFTAMQINISSFNIDGDFREFPMITATRN